MSLTIKLDGSILNLEHCQAGNNWHPTCYKFKTLGIICYLGEGDITLNENIGDGLPGLMNYKMTNTALLQYISHYTFNCILPNQIERQTGRYSYKSASGRVVNEDNKTILYLGGTSLEDIKVLAQKIEDGEIWPYKIPKKEHMPAYKFYTKTYGMPTFLIVIGIITAWMTLTMMKTETYLYHVKKNDIPNILLVQCMWGFVLTLISGGFLVYYFSKDLKPVLRIILTITCYAGLFFFVGCLSYGIFVS